MDPAEQSQQGRVTYVPIVPLAVSRPRPSPVAGDVKVAGASAMSMAKHMAAALGSK